MVTQSDEAITLDNALCMQMDFAPQIYLQTSTSEIVADIANGTLSGVIYNFGGDAGQNLSLPVYKYVDASNRVLIGATEPFSIGAK